MSIIGFDLQTIEILSEISIANFFYISCHSQKISPNFTVAYTDLDSVSSKIFWMYSSVTTSKF